MKQFKRIRDWMDIPGHYMPGIRNSITDVPGVTVGHHTMHDEDRGMNTGVTVIRPHPGNVYAEKVPAAVHVGNGYGKTTGIIQVEELGEIESMIGLTNTLSVSSVLQGLLEYHLALLSPEQNSINIIVGETNDAQLNDIKKMAIQPEHVRLAIQSLSEVVEEGAVGAGAGTICYGFKGGIGTSSRRVKEYTVGVLVQTNFGGNLHLYGHPVQSRGIESPQTSGSCMVIVATDAPMLDRQLRRLAKRAIIGLTNTGSYIHHGSGEIVIAFSNCKANIIHRHDTALQSFIQLPDEDINPYFEATVEAVQEAVYNSLTMAEQVKGPEGRMAEGFDMARYDEIPLKNDTGDQHE